MTAFLVISQFITLVSRSILKTDNILPINCGRNLRKAIRSCSAWEAIRESVGEMVACCTHTPPCSTASLSLLELWTLPAHKARQAYNNSLTLASSPPHKFKKGASHHKFFWAALFLLHFLNTIAPRKWLRKVYLYCFDGMTCYFQEGKGLGLACWELPKGGRASLQLQPRTPASGMTPSHSTPPQ